MNDKIVAFLDKFSKGTFMNISDAFELLVVEYLSKCKEYGCDSCIAQIFCIENNLRTSRYPQDDCPDKLKKYLEQR